VTLYTFYQEYAVQKRVLEFGKNSDLPRKNCDLRRETQSNHYLRTVSVQRVESVYRELTRPVQSFATKVLILSMMRDYGVKTIYGLNKTLLSINPNDEQLVKEVESHLFKRKLNGQRLMRQHVIDRFKWLYPPSESILNHSVFVAIAPVSSLSEEIHETYEKTIKECITVDLGVAKKISDIETCIDLFSKLTQLPESSNSQELVRLAVMARYSESSVFERVITTLTRRVFTNMFSWADSAALADELLLLEKQNRQVRQDWYALTSFWKRKKRFTKILTSRHHTYKYLFQKNKKVGPTKQDFCSVHTRTLDQ
jgi:hypothetical protein|tara:strand:- start:16967 stop:17899 length:933 start_codon:yes stop_codon:yes gene_type:complete